MGLTEKSDSDALEIRPAKGADYEQVAAVWSASGLRISRGGRDGPESFVRQCACFGGLYLVAVMDGKIVGVVLGTHDQRKGWINRLSVLPAYRRRGIAARLVNTCDAAIRSRGIEIISALIEPSSPESSALFEKLGFRTDVEVQYFRKLSHPDA